MPAIVRPPTFQENQSRQSPARHGGSILLDQLARIAPEWRHKVFVGYVLAMVLVFLVPVPSNPLTASGGFDKAVHFGMFLGFSLLYYLDRHARVGSTLLISIAFAAAIEVVQWLLPYRDADWADFLAGAAGGGLGVLAVTLVERKWT